MISARALSFAYDDGPLVLESVDLDIEDGETVALMGPNGAGKTTLLKCIAGLYEPDEGTIDLEGVVGFAPEDPDDALFAESVEAELEFFPRNRGIAVAENVERALSEMAITDLRERVPQTLSAGEKRRVSLAAVLAGDPDVIALDEPTSGLDTDHAETLGELLQRIDRTVVVATHDADFALQFTDRVAIVTDGRIETVGSTDDLLASVDFDFETHGIRPPGPVSFAREMAWDEAPSTVAEAARRLDEVGER